MEVAHEKHYVDRALWSELPIRLPPPGLTGRILGSPASRGGNAEIARRSCGDNLVRRSWGLIYDVPHSASLDTTFYLLQRGGRWLLWFQY